MTIMQVPTMCMDTIHPNTGLVHCVLQLISLDDFKDFFSFFK